MSLERHAPDAILAQTSLTGSLAAIQDDPDSPDGSWLVATSNNTNTDVRVSFATPSGAPAAGAGLQEFRALVRQFDGAQTGTPLARVELWENGALVRAGSDINVTSAVGQVLSFTWDASELAQADGSLVECLVVGTKSGGAPGARNSVDVGAVEWNAEVSAESTISVGDAGAGADAIAALSVAASLADAGSGADVPGPSAAAALTDAGAASDLVALTALVAAGDSGSGSDALGGIAADLVIADGGSGSEALVAAVVLALLDTAAGADLPTLAITATVTDAGSAVEVLDLMTATLRSVADAGLGSDTLAGVTIQALVGDVALSAEQLVMAGAAALTDAGLGVDSPALTVLATVGDAAAGTEQLLATVTLQLADAASGQDQVAVSVSLALAEVAAGSEQLALAALLAVAEAANGSETTLTVDKPGGSGPRLVTLTFTLLARRMRWSFRQRALAFGALRRRAITFALN